VKARAIEPKIASSNSALYDAHNHLQDERLAGIQQDISDIFVQENIRGIVVNGSCEDDWPAVRDLAMQHLQVIPSFGYHPWYIKQRSPDWQKRLVELLDKMPSAIGEIGLDRWIKDYDSADQERVFISQLRVAAERNLPASIHCLKAWGRLLEVLRTESRPACGFLLHSFGGPQEMINPLADLGAYFSLPGYFSHEHKSRQRETFRHVPPDRLLIETDAPDQLLPVERVKYPLADLKTGKALNHPGNLSAIYRFAVELFEESEEQLAQRVETNFKRLFGTVFRDIA